MPIPNPKHQRLARMIFVWIWQMINLAVCDEHDLTTRINLKNDKLEKEKWEKK